MWFSDKTEMNNWAFSDKTETNEDGLRWGEVHF